MKHATVLETPAWKTSEHPPLSPREATRAAITILPGMVSPLKDWKLDEIALVEWDDKGHWIYIVTFRHITTSVPSGGLSELRTTTVRPATISIPVLLNGAAIEPMMSMSAKAD